MNLSLALYGGVVVLLALSGYFYLSRNDMNYTAILLVLGWTALAFIEGNQYLQPYPPGAERLIVLLMIGILGLLATWSTLWLLYIVSCGRYGIIWSISTIWLGALLAFWYYQRLHPLEVLLLDIACGLFFTALWIFAPKKDPASTTDSAILFTFVYWIVGFFLLIEWLNMHPYFYIENGVIVVVGLIGFIASGVFAAWLTTSLLGRVLKW